MSLRRQTAEKFDRKGMKHIRVRYTIENINVAQVLDKLLPIMAEKNESTAFNPSLIKRLCGGMIFLSQSMRDAMIIKVCNQSKDNIIMQINRSLSDNGMGIELGDISFAGGERLMNISADVAEVNYESVALKLMPKIIEQVPSNEKTEAIIKALDIVGDDRDELVKGILQSLSDEKKEELTAHFVNSYSKELCDLLNKLISKNGIAAEITDINIAK